jgi:hypothetical protein
MYCGVLWLKLNNKPPPRKGAVHPGNSVFSNLLYQTRPFPLVRAHYFLNLLREKLNHHTHQLTLLQAMSEVVIDNSIFRRRVHHLQRKLNSSDEYFKDINSLLVITGKSDEDNPYTKSAVLHVSF